jgi:Ca2+-binding RTX toxin-like protein
VVTRWDAHRLLRLHGFNFDVFAIDADGTDPVNLTDDGGLDGHPDWQPAVATSPPSVTIEIGGSCGPNGRSGSVDLLVTDADTAPEQLAVEVRSSDHRLVRARDLVEIGNGEPRTQAVTGRDRSGSAEVTVSVSDGQSAIEVTLGVHLGSQRTDVLIGSDEPDLLLGRAGDDVLIGRAGNDVLCGGGGRDILIGGSGGDLFGGGQGFDLAIDFQPSQGDHTDGRVP